MIYERSLEFYFCQDAMVLGRFADNVRGQPLDDEKIDLLLKRKWHGRRLFPKWIEDFDKDYPTEVFNAGAISHCFAFATKDPWTDAYQHVEERKELYKEDAKKWMRKYLSRVDLE